MTDELPLHELEWPDEGTVHIERFSGLEAAQMHPGMTAGEFVARFEKIVQDMLWTSGTRVRVVCSPRTEEKLRAAFFAAGGTE